MFIDYQTQVYADYENKKANNALSHRLVHPTPAKIREECIAVCHERYRTKDEEILRTFFGKKDSVPEYIQAIRKHDPDKFKPLVNYLRKQISNTDVKNIELLAWLTDFESRPYQIGRRYQTNLQETNKVEEILSEEVAQKEVIPKKEPKSISTTNDEPQKEEKVSNLLWNKWMMLRPAGYLSKQSAFRKKGLAGLMFFILSITGYWSYQRYYGRLLAGKESCMYWAGDHYIQVSCNQTFHDTLVIGLDSFKLKNFKKITQPDTITLNAVGNVWYSKKDNNIEFFTAPGYHPIQQRRLKPISEYIIIKYIHPDSLPPSN
ncbi:hypothetical protein [Chitinophaga sp. sic0106]|uniref:hypothetical protein n=1 Tax=Chitinophaga sp. sic0106 TaxID=2854785 RepID=UPI001C459190|nr:hypothetical protein [Chitinophaga sp. sic0106]MBV7532846.1 hypothetical protein [Chitinophaga sp. sic0106]